MNDMTSTRDICPDCGQANGLPIIWGKLSTQAAAKIEAGEAICGGCDMFGGTVCGTVMNRECLDCGHQWHLRGAD